MMEVTYRVIFDHGVEKERTRISSRVITEMIPRKKIIGTWILVHEYEFVEVEYKSAGAIRTEKQDKIAREWAMAMAKNEVEYGHTHNDRAESIVTCDTAEEVPGRLKKHSDVSDGEEGSTYGVGVVKITTKTEDGEILSVSFLGAAVGNGP